MLIERNNNDLVIRISSSKIGIKELQSILDQFRYLEISKRSKVGKKQIAELIRFVRNKRKV